MFRRLSSVLIVAIFMVVAVPAQFQVTPRIMRINIPGSGLTNKMVATVTFSNSATATFNSGSGELILYAPVPITNFGGSSSIKIASNVATFTISYPTFSFNATTAGVSAATILTNGTSRGRLQTSVVINKATGTTNTNLFWLKTVNGTTTNLFGPVGGLYATTNDISNAVFRIEAVLNPNDAVSGSNYLSLGSSTSIYGGSTVLVNE